MVERSTSRTVGSWAVCRGAMPVFFPCICAFLAISAFSAAVRCCFLAFSAAFCLASAAAFCCTCALAALASSVCLICFVPVRLRTVCIVAALTCGFVAFFFSVRFTTVPVLATALFFSTVWPVFLS